MGDLAIMDVTSWQLETQAKLDAAGVIARHGNRNVAVTIEPGKYEFYSLRIPPHVMLVGGSGWGSREVDLVYVGNGGDTCVTLDGGYSTGFVGCQIRSKKLDADTLVGAYVNGCINPVVQNLRVDFRGTETAGIVIAGRESVVVSRCEFRASAPVIYSWGDNVVFRDMDLGCTGESVVTLRSNPHHVVFDGSQSWQGGTYAIRGVTSDERTGQGLAIYNLRYEQTTATNEPGILIECNGQAFEALTEVNCRWTKRQNPATVVISNPVYPLVPKLTEVGCFKPRK